MIKQVYSFCNVSLVLCNYVFCLVDMSYVTCFWGGSLRHVVLMIIEETALCPYGTYCVTQAPLKYIVICGP